MFIPFRFIRVAACAVVLAFGSAACTTPSPAPRAQAARILPSVQLATMIKNMQVPADQVTYFDQAGKPLTLEAFSKAINTPAGPEYNVKATRHFNEGTWSEAAEVHLVNRAPVARKVP